MRLITPLEERRPADLHDHALDHIRYIRSAMERLNQASHKLAEILYKASPPPDQGGPAAPQGGAKPGEDVVDAEYTVKN